MTQARLTGKQRRLVREIRNLLASQMLEPEVIVAEAEPGFVTTHLELARLQLVRGAVVLKYVLTPIRN